MRGRVMSVYTMVFVGTTPIGNLIVSSVAGTAGVPVAFVIAGLPCLLVALLAAWLWRRQKSPKSAEAPSREPLHTVELAD
jgi:MFS family permease